MKAVIRILLWGSLVILVGVVGFGLYNFDVIRRVFLGGVHVYETTPPKLPPKIPRPAVLVFSKTNAFRHEEAILAANALLSDLARSRGWGEYHTENGAAFTPAVLARFDAVVFNNVSGDVFTPAQREALKSFIENGGGFVGIHAAGDSSSRWPWYIDEVIGAKFIGHPLNPQFQQATVHIEDRVHPATKTLPPTLKLTDEWYSFDKSPRQRPGYQVLATLDERSYSPKLFFKDLRMGKDHPVAWSHCIDKGRVYYNAMGHTAEIYANAAYRRSLIGAVEWAMRRQGEGCSGTTSADRKADGSAAPK